MDMNNNDILIRLRYALDIKDRDMVRIFQFGDVNITEDEVQKMLTKTNERDLEENIYELRCDNSTLEGFFNGLIVYKRGKQDPKPGQPERPPKMIKNSSSVNNVMLKKVKIALQLTTEDMLAIWEAAGVHVTKGELSALLRKEGHSNYRKCGDRYARNFLKGLGFRYRG
ncbi:DUF1456 family protein [Oceanobacillus kapialis]|uniref:DUF1456 family protein n=1 Tax=Oceanobacillus kapialis TaxID=481353 RepID=UPI00384D257F